MGRLTGAPGFCIATLGPGATNLTTGVGDAYLDRSPLIALTCNINTDQIGRRIQMYIDHHALFGPVTKASYPLRKGRIAATVEEALRISLSEPHGPVHLDLPEDVALAPAAEEALPAPAGRKFHPAPEAAIQKLGAFAPRQILISQISSLEYSTIQTRLCGSENSAGQPVHGSDQHRPDSSNYWQTCEGEPCLRFFGHGADREPGQFCHS